MSTNFGGISKRHFKRLAQKEIENANINTKCEIDKYSETEMQIEIEAVTPADSEINIINESCVPGTHGEKNTLVESLADWCVKNKVVRKTCEDLLTILAKEGLNVPTCKKTLLGIKYNSIQKDTVSPGEYFHFGLEKALQMLKLTLPESTNTVLIDIGVDGIQIFKSSGQTLWPILGALSELKEITPFLIGAYIGPRKPEKVKDFLAKFVKEYKYLQNEGVEINGRRRKLEIRAFICDAPAKAFLTGTVGHTSANGCPKCTQKGKKINNRLAYDITIGIVRTDNDFRSRTDMTYHNKSFQQDMHPLEDINIHMISQFPIDVMHLIDLGITRKFLTYIWTNKHMAPKLTGIQKQNIDLKLISMKAFIPKEFCRKPRSLEEIQRWKATEFRQVVLYTGIVLFKDELNKNLYEHFLLLCGAYRLISCPQNCTKNLDCVQEMLETYIYNFSILYGRDKVSYNVHNLLHLAECVKLYGNVDTFSAYKFENYMQILKQDCRQPTKVLEQINNRIMERMTRPKENARKKNRS